MKVANEEVTGITTRKQVLRASSLMGGGDCGAPTLVDVADGVITRIRPLHYDMSYDPRDFNAWKLEVNGKVLEPPLRPPIGPVSLAYRDYDLATGVSLSGWSIA